MPEFIARALRLLDNSAANMDELSQVLELDPGLAAKILRISNSAYYGMRKRVSSLKLALVVLGVREVRDIILGISIFEAFCKARVPAGAAQRVWMECLRTAAFARMLCQELGLALQDEEFIAGLLSGVGQLVFYREFGYEYASLRQRHNSWRGLLPAECELAGCTHPEVAMALADRWNLPHSLADALWLQYPVADQSLAEAAAPELAAVLRIAKLAQWDDFGDDVPLDCLEDTEAWAMLENAPHPASADRRRGLLQSCLQKIEEMPPVGL